MLFLLLACKPDPQTTPGVDIDLVSPLLDGEVRAGVITDEAALFGGISAEGRLGDIKLYNSQARFVIEAPRPGSYYIDYGGGVIDADAVRPEGQPGRDVIDELSVMVGLGRLMNAESVTVISDGTDGQPAEVLAEGPGAPMQLLTGSLESDSLVPEADVWIATRYILEPDSPLLMMETTVTWRDDEMPLEVGDVAIIASDAVVPWGAGEGLEGSGPWPAAIGRRDEVAVAIFPEADEVFTSSAVQQSLSSLGPTIAAFQAPVTLDEGDTLTWRRTLGVAGSLSELTDAWYARTGAAVQTISGDVTADGSPVSGARVHLLDDAGDPMLLARTDEAGQWSLSAPAGITAAVATGRGEGRHVDIAEGAGWMSPYTTAAIQAASLESMSAGAEPIPFAEGYGISTTEEISGNTSLSLATPGWVTVTTADGLPATVWVAFAEGDPVTGDSRLAPGRPSGLAAEGWIGSDRVRMPVEPGAYTVTAHRGIRYEPYTEVIEVFGGENIDVTVSLEEVYSPDALVADPHSHAAPSGDADIPMSHRLLTHAGAGVAVHFGTDHDHISDYRPLVSALGIEDVLQSVVADEISPVLRGHLNVYPLSAVIGEPNNGALRWWQEIRQTPELFALIREQVGDGVIQLNHPFDSGMLAAAGYSNGVVSDADYWSDDFDAVEVINDGDHAEMFPAYLDMTARGMLPTPVGVSDSHGYRSGVGESVTFLHTGGQALTDAVLIEAMAARATVVSTGPYLEVTTADGQWAPGQTLAGPVDLDIAVWAASWIPVDRVVVYINGQRDQEIPVEGEGAQRLQTTLTLSPDDDAVVVIVAEADGSSHTVYTTGQPWAMAAAIQIDVGGDGWSPPMPSIVVE